jgi:hypothetical protein
VEGFIIKKVDYGSPIFQKTFAKLDVQVIKEARKVFGELPLLDVSCAPAKLHLHTLKGLTVRSAVDPTRTVAVYTIHITTNDKYKASFTFEDGTAYMRVCGTHDWVDKNPGG